ncbi:heavy metal translocating P-type ATPase [Pelomonas sp. Root1444]|uniref:heavy metal translocating P-type ATPase n=1 Tax=Pelomonas sp. Root1444 TaxID=1736464 RepID=UPI0009EB68B2
MSTHEHAHGDHADLHDEHDHAHGAGQAHGSESSHAHPQESPCCGSACGAETRAPVAATSGSGLLLRIPAMDCPTEEGQIRRALERFPEVRGLRFDLPARALDIDAPQATWEPVIAAINGIGFKTETLSAPPPAEDTAKAQRAELIRLVAALLVAVGAELVHFVAPDTLAWKAVGMAIAAGAIALSGLAVFRKGLSALLHGQLNINALMSVAVAGAFAIGQWPEAAMVMALYSLAELIEARSVERARNAITGLLALSPPQVEVRQTDGAWASVDAKTVAVGSTARVKPGERFALDGRVTAGQSAVDQSPVTGESIPVDKAPGDSVFAGTINQSGSLEFEVTKSASDTVLAGIIHAVEQAQGQRAPTQRFVDKFAAIYTPAIFVLALAVAVGTPFLMGWPWLTALYKALVLLVIACPCALVISTPVTVVSGLAAAARRGILIKGGVHLEEARKLKVVALDKTGTLTEGKPRLVAHAALPQDLPEAEVLRIAKSLASRSDHPVSKAVATGLDGEALPVEDFGADMGRGVHGTVNGRQYILGNHRWVHERGLCSAELEARLEEHEAQGRTLSLLADQERVLGLFAVADTVKETSKQAVADLKALGIHSIMLTGDNPSTAKAIGSQVGIDDVQANLLPEDKLKVISELGQAQSTGMVGDGVNDSPALAAAAVGFSMGGAGTDTAKEAADVLIMNDDLRKVPETIRLSKRTYAILWQNITIALGIKAVFFVLAVFGSATMWMAVFADMGASLLVVFNGLRLLKSSR